MKTPLERLETIHPHCEDGFDTANGEKIDFMIQIARSSDLAMHFASGFCVDLLTGFGGTVILFVYTTG